MADSSATIDVVLPVHDEGASIATTLREFHRVVMLEGGQPIRFVVCEDGSSDDSVSVPEPGSLVLLGSGLAAVAAGIRRRRRGLTPHAAMLSARLVRARHR